MCSRTVGTLSHVIESAGIATVGISSIRAQTERLRPPRALYCEFPLGRPLGKPADAAFQHRVISAAFALLERESGPVLEDFPERIGDVDDVPLVCSLPPRYDPSLAPEVDEAIGLRPAYDRQLRATGRTSVGRAAHADDIPAAITSFLRFADGAPVDECGFKIDSTGTYNLRAYGGDIRHYYEEAAMALAGHVPAARSAEAWFFRSTATGQLLLRAQRRLHESGRKDKLAEIVPRTQALAAGIPLRE